VLALGALTVRRMRRGEAEPNHGMDVGKEGCAYDAFYRTGGGVELASEGGRAASGEVGFQSGGFNVKGRRGSASR
jgi:hypothetical protein